MGKIIYGIVAKIPDPKGFRGDTINIPLNISFEVIEDAEKWIEEVGPHSLFSDFEICKQVFHPHGNKVSI